MCTGKRQPHIRNVPTSRTAVTGIGPYVEMWKCLRICRKTFTICGGLLRPLSQLRWQLPFRGSLWDVCYFELLQITREKARKTEGVFLVGSRRSGGKSNSLRARFLLEKQKKMLDSSCKF